MVKKGLGSVSPGAVTEEGETSVVNDPRVRVSRGTVTYDNNRRRIQSIT